MDAALDIPISNITARRPALVSSRAQRTAAAGVQLLWCQQRRVSHV
jgi:hypothetical protein